MAPGNLRIPTFSDAEEAEMANADIDTQLRHAAETGNVEKVRQLLAIPEINVNACDENGCTPLYEASHEASRRVCTLSY